MFRSTVYRNKGVTFESNTRFYVIEHLIQNSVLTKDHTVLENIFPSLDSLKTESVFDVIKYRNGEFHASVYN